MGGGVCRSEFATHENRGSEMSVVFDGEVLVTRKNHLAPTGLSVLSPPQSLEMTRLLSSMMSSSTHLRPR